MQPDSGVLLGSDYTKKSRQFLIEGLLQYNNHQYKEALKSVSYSIALNPSEPSSFNLLGNIYSKLNQPDKALQCYTKSLELDPCHSDCLYNIGTLYLRQREFHRAEYFLRKACISADKKGEALINLGITLMELDRLDEAERSFREAINIIPEDPDIYLNLGNCLRYQQRPLEALEQYRKASVLNPKDPDIYVNIGVVMRDLLNLQEAIEQYKKAITIQHDHAEAHYNLALALLLAGNYKEGWQQYQWRWKTSDFKHCLPNTERLWDGGIGNYRLLLRAEQGFGDTIQFFRYPCLLAEKGLDVIIQCQEQLIRLLRGQCGITEVIAYNDSFKDYDFHRPLLDLPYLMQSDKYSIPSKIPYIQAWHEDVKKWHGIIHKSGKTTEGRMKIGLAWTGSRTNKRAMHRSCSLEDVRPLLGFENALFYHISKEDCSLELSILPEHLRPIDLSGLIDDFADTAAIIENLDLIITIDTAIAHLAGAMGRIVWLMLHYSSDWRWLLKDRQSTWYPTISIFRQKRFGKWDGVISDISRELTQKMQLQGAKNCQKPL